MIQHDKNMKKNFKEGGERHRKYARTHNFSPSMVSKVLDDKVPTVKNAPVGGSIWNILRQLKKDGYTKILPWAETIDPFSEPYKGIGLGAFDDNGHLVLSAEIIKNTCVPGEMKIMIATIDALSADDGYCSASDARLQKLLFVSEDYLLDSLIFLLGQKLIDIKNIDGVRQIRVEVQK